jgi:transcriptional regulator with XRE-family HTH domain
MDKSIYTKEHARLVEKLKKARLDAGLEQKDVAKFLHKTQSYISKIESGQRKLDIIRLKELAKIYKRSVNDLIS